MNWQHVCNVTNVLVILNSCLAVAALPAATGLTDVCIHSLGITHLLKSSVAVSLRLFDLSTATGITVARLITLVSVAGF